MIGNHQDLSAFLFLKSVRGGYYRKFKSHIRLETIKYDVVTGVAIPMTKLWSNRSVHQTIVIRIFLGFTSVFCR